MFAVTCGPKSRLWNNPTRGEGYVAAFAPEAAPGLPLKPVYGSQYKYQDSQEELAFLGPPAPPA